MRDQPLARRNYCLAAFCGQRRRAKEPGNTTLILFHILSELFINNISQSHFKMRDDFKSCARHVSCPFIKL